MTPANDRPSKSGLRRRLQRVRAELSVVVARRDGQKVAARVIDVSTGGMYLRSEHAPQYGEALTVVVRLGDAGDWLLLPATVRWFASGSFGVAFEGLDARQATALAEFIEYAAA